VLFLYGWGGAIQQRAIRQHQGHYAAFDLGYWERDGLYNRKWRVSIDGFHCPQLMMDGPRPSLARLAKAKIKAQDKGGDPDGPILLIGTGPKSQKIGAQHWTRNMSRTLAKRFPNRPVWYKPKPMRGREAGIRCSRIVSDEIERVLPQVSLVVCRHSNVAIDACKLGVPVVCEDGAGAAIYPKLNRYTEQPDLATRQEFLERVAWWQWSITEIRNGEMWPWLQSQLTRLS